MTDQTDTIAADVKKLIADAANDSTPTTGEDVKAFLLGEEQTPTPEDARQLFKERADCAAILTTEGWMKRDGTIG